MISKAAARRKLNTYHMSVFTKISDIRELIIKNAEVGYDYMEVFVDSRKYNKFKAVLNSKGYYVASTAFTAIPNCVAMYVDWGGSF